MFLSIISTFTTVVLHCGAALGRNEASRSIKRSIQIWHIFVCAVIQVVLTACPSKRAQDIGHPTFCAHIVVVGVLLGL